MILRKSILWWLTVMPCDPWFVIPVGGAEDGEAMLARESSEREAGKILGALGLMKMRRPENERG
jgi:hypothetical protein